jgi:hypothetical protein
MGNSYEWGSSHEVHSAENADIKPPRGIQSFGGFLDLAPRNTLKLFTRGMQKH